MKNINLDTAIDRNRWLHEGPRFRASVFTKCRLGIQGDTSDWLSRREFGANALATITHYRSAGSFVAKRYNEKIWPPYAQNLTKMLGESIYVFFANHLHLGAFRCEERTASHVLSCLLNVDGDSIFLANSEGTEFVTIDYDADWPISSEQYELCYVGERIYLAEKFI